MKAQDLMDQNNNRAFVIRKITELCDDLSLSYDYNEKTFKVKLPALEEMPIINQAIRDRGRGKLKDIDMSIFGPDSGVHEDELPPVDKPLDEGETPNE